MLVHRAGSIRSRSRASSMFSSRRVRRPSFHFTDSPAVEKVESRLLLSIEAVTAGAEPLSTSSIGTHAVSSDGRFVVFDSSAENLVDNDANGARDLFLKDLSTGNVTRLTNGAGRSFLEDSTLPSISGNGRFVAFVSNSKSLVADTPGSALSSHLFVMDLSNGMVSLIGGHLFDDFPGSMRPFVTALSISDNGERVAFISGTSNNFAQSTKGVYIYDRAAGWTKQIAMPVLFGAPAVPTDLMLSGDGRFLVGCHVWIDG